MHLEFHNFSYLLTNALLQKFKQSLQTTIETCPCGCETGLDENHEAHSSQLSLIKRGCDNIFEDLEPPILLKKSPLDLEITRCWNHLHKNAILYTKKSYQIEKQTFYVAFIINEMNSKRRANVERSTLNFLIGPEKKKPENLACGQFLGSTAASSSCLLLRLFNHRTVF